MSNVYYWIEFRANGPDNVELEIHGLTTAQAIMIARLVSRKGDGCAICGEEFHAVNEWHTGEAAKLA